MPRLPRIDAEAGFRVPEIPVLTDTTQAIPSGLANLGEGLSRRGQGIARAYHVRQAREEERVRDEAVSYAVTAGSDFDRAATKFIQENEEKDTLAEDFQVWADDQIKASIDAAPSQKAGERFRQMVLPQADNQYGRLVNQVEQMRQTRSIVAVDAVLQNTRESYEETGLTRGLDNARKGLQLLVEERWSERAPALAAKLSEHIDTQIAQMAIANDPQYAEFLLENSKSINEETRNTLRHRLEMSTSLGNELDQDRIKRAWDNSIEHARTEGELVAAPAKEVIDAAFGKNAQRVMEGIQSEADTHNAAVGLINSLADKNEFYTQHALDAASAEKKIPAKSITYASAVLVERAKLREKDPGGWIKAFNPVVKMAYEKARGSSAPESALQEAYSIQWRYMGQAPVEGITDEERGRYLNLPSGRRHLMSKAEATTKAQFIMRGDLGESMKALDAMKAEYPSGAIFAQAYNDMITLPADGQRLPQSVQAVALVEDPGRRRRVLSAVRNPEAMTKLSDDKRAELDKQITANPSWTKFLASMLGEPWQRAQEMAGFKDAIMAYAVAEGRGMKEREAAAISVKTILDNNIYFTEVNGRWLGVPRYRPEAGAQDLTDRQLPPVRDMEELNTYGWRIKQAIHRLEPRSIRLETPDGDSIFPTTSLHEKGSVQQFEHIRQIVVNSGFFVPEPDGQTATLYVPSNRGDIQLVDKDGNPFEMDYDKLDVYGRMVGFDFISEGGVHHKGSVLLKDPLPGPILEKREVLKPGFHKGAFPIPIRNWETQYRTNWPVTPESFKLWPGPKAKPRTNIAPPPFRDMSEEER